VGPQVPHAPEDEAVTPEKFLTALIDLNKRVQALESRATEQDQTLLTVAEAMTVLANDFTARLDKVERDMKSLVAPVVVDGDGVVQQAAEVLVTECDELRRHVNQRVDAIQAQIHQHLEDHTVNGARPRAIDPRTLDAFIDEQESRSQFLTRNF
jgi:uncharacterized coiled-coil protein SlyX